MADLHDAAGEDVLRCLPCRVILITGHASEGISRVLELREELDHGLEVLGWTQEANGDVMGDVIHAVDERDLLVVALHRHVLPIDNQRASETFPVAVPSGDIIVVWQRFQFPHQCAVDATPTFAIVCCKCTNTRPLQMR